MFSVRAVRLLGTGHYAGMAFRLQIGDVSVQDVGDVIQLKARIAAAMQSGGDWVSVGDDPVREFYVSPGVPISLQPAD